jgi:hypothetical protein
MSEKPKKRLVSKGRYGELIRTRARLLFGTILFDTLGVLSFSSTIWDFKYLIAAQYSGIWWFTKVCGFAFCAWSFHIANYCFKQERKVERVALVTMRTVNLLPPEESLVRASDLPPSQQAELLRAAQYGKETPAEELLRASTDRQDT